ncbi:MAG TPA: class III poly(R)-hydroxyalkanoic acid synthase subunit PhaC [Gammaproteobacteria bacterium]|nr:class III poly(R)-hydroxyalkanoic acid synthase subunit PhaC [Gammaproteobacteria bacterium]
MPAIELSWEALSAEVAAWEKKLASGHASLREAADAKPGASPRDCVFGAGKARLYRYRPLREDVQPVPTLVVYALVNRPSMADLERERSLVHGLLERGVDVHLIEWEDPSGLDRGRTLADYVERDLGACVEWLDRGGGINLLGICQGGTFALCYAALNPSRVRNLVTTVTPVDFRTPEDTLSHWLRYVDLELFGAGNVAGDALNGLFLTLKPMRLMQQKYVGLVDQLDDPAAVATFMRMEQWIFDSPDLAATALREFAQGCYRDNRLIKGELDVGGRRVDLRAIAMPVLNVFAAEDHLVPPAASRALKTLVASKDYTELEVPGGHIGIYVGKRSRQLVAGTIAEWLERRC